MTVEQMQAELNRKREVLTSAIAEKYGEYLNLMKQLEKVEEAIRALRGAERGIRLAAEVLDGSNVGRPA